MQGILDVQGDFFSEKSINVQVEINVQGEKFFKNIKRAGQNRLAGGTFSGKSINEQGKNL